MFIWSWCKIKFCSALLCNKVSGSFIHFLFCVYLFYYFFSLLWTNRTRFHGSKEWALQRASLLAWWVDLLQLLVEFFAALFSYLNVCYENLVTHSTSQRERIKDGSSHVDSVKSYPPSSSFLIFAGIPSLNEHHTQRPQLSQLPG